jgi:haloalkane dehalogenase
VLFIHGMPTSGQLWTRIIEKLRGQFTCLAVDLPGLGKTPQIPYGPKPLEALADRIEQLRVEHGIAKWHVVGHDAGAAVAVHYAFRFQERVDHLALLSPAVFPELKPFQPFRILRTPILGELLAPVVSAIFWRIALRYALEEQRAELRSVVRDFQAPFSGPWGAWRLMSVLRWGKPAEVLAAVPEMLPQLLMPTLIFQGSRDTAVPDGFAQQACELIPESKCSTVDSGHFIPLNNPEVVAAELLRFFEVGASA